MERAYRADPAHIPTPPVFRWVKKLGSMTTVFITATLVAGMSQLYVMPPDIEVSTASGKIIRMYAGTGVVMVSSGALIRYQIAP